MKDQDKVNFIIPINVDLKIDCNFSQLSHDLSTQLYSDQVGGDPNASLTAINNIEYKCITDISSRYKFYYDETNIKVLNGSKYLGKGSNTTVMSILQTNGRPETNGVQCVIRITELTNAFDVEKYKSDKILCGRYVPDAYYFGNIHAKNNVILSYVIVPKYEVFSKNNIKILSESAKRHYLLDLLECLNLLQENGYVLWDLKIDNVGYDYNYNCVLIDYSHETILKSYILKAPNTYYPTYIIINSVFYDGTHYKQNVNSIFNFIKLSVAGLADVILNLFFEIKIGENISSASLSNLHYGGNFQSVNGNSTISLHLYDTTVHNSNWHTKSFMNLINAEKIKEYLELLEIQGEDVDGYKKMLLTTLFNYSSCSGLLSPEYSKIPTFKEVLETITNFKYEDPYFSMVGGNTYKENYKRYLKKNKILLEKINKIL